VGERLAGALRVGADVGKSGAVEDVPALVRLLGKALKVLR